MKSRIWLGLLLATLLAACQTGASPTRPTTESATAIPTPVQQVIATEEEVEVEAYPPPLQAVYNNPYPDPTDGDVIEWRHAEYLILSGGVKEVAQYNSLEVTLTLDDGRKVSTKEPVIDEVFKVIERCGDHCEDIVRVTE